MAEERVLLVLTNAVAGREEEFEMWYEQVHLPDVLRVPGVVAAQRYGMAPMDVPQVDEGPALESPTHRFMAVYELDRDPDEVMKELLRRFSSGEMVLDDSLDSSSIGISGWQVRGQRQHV